MDSDSAAQFLCVSKRALLRYTRSGLIESRKVSGRLVFDVEDLKDFKDKNSELLSEYRGNGYAKTTCGYSMRPQYYGRSYFTDCKFCGEPIFVGKKSKTCWACSSGGLIDKIAAGEKR